MALWSLTAKPRQWVVKHVAATLAGALAFAAMLSMFRRTKPAPTWSLAKDDQMEHKEEQAAYDVKVAPLPLTHIEIEAELRRRGFLK